MAKNIKVMHQSDNISKAPIDVEPIFSPNDEVGCVKTLSTLKVTSNTGISWSFQCTHSEHIRVGTVLVDHPMPTSKIHN